MLTGTAVKKKFNKISDFPTCFKLGVGTGYGSTEKLDPDPDRHKKLCKF
jgi:hypothetical protein